MELPCKSTLVNHFSIVIHLEKDNITNIDNVPEIVSNYRKFNEIADQFDVVLGIDACSFDRTSIDGKKYSFCFYCQPIHPTFHCFPVHIVATPNGKATDVIVDIAKILIDILKSCDINVLYVSRPPFIIPIQRYISERW